MIADLANALIVLLLISVVCFDELPENIKVLLSVSTLCVCAYLGKFMHQNPDEEAFWLL